MMLTVRRQPASGFTLIELLVTVALVAVMAGLAAPSFRDFIVRRNLESVTSDFQSDIMKARTTAMNKNICVTMCMSSTAANSNPTCATSGADWQPGWRFTGVDPAPKMLDLARVVLGDEINPRVDLIEGAYIETDAAFCKAFRPAHAARK